MAQSETVRRILDAAEQLFAEKGFAETSLRSITSKANVNLAAVNYHFGSKKALIQAVFSRFLNPFCASLERELDRRETLRPTKIASIEELLEMLVEQALVARLGRDDDLSTFMRLVGLAFSESQGHLRYYLNDMYGRVFRRYMALVQEAAPQIPPVELFWRVYFMLGASAFSMSGSKALQAMMQSDFGIDISIDKVIKMMVPFLAAGMRAPSSLLESSLIDAQACLCKSPSRSTKP